MRDELIENMNKLHTAERSILICPKKMMYEKRSGHVDAFSEFYHVYAIDTRGHGKTPRGNMPFTIRQFADDLREFMDEHQIEKAHHFIASKQPEEFNRAVSDFLQNEI